MKEKKRIGFLIKFSLQNKNVISNFKLNSLFFQGMKIYPLYGGYMNSKIQYELMITLPENVNREDFSNIEIEIKEFKEQIWSEEKKHEGQI